SAWSRRAQATWAAISRSIRSSSASRCCSELSKYSIGSPFSGLGYFGTEEITVSCCLFRAEVLSIPLVPVIALPPLIPPVCLPSAPQPFLVLPSACAALAQLQLILPAPSLQRSQPLFSPLRPFLILSATSLHHHRPSLSQLWPSLILPATSFRRSQP